MLKAAYREEYRTFREVLIAERKKAGLTQEELAAALGVRQTLISDCETGERRLDVVEFIMLVRALGANPAEVLVKAEQAFPERRRGNKRR